MGHVSSFFKRSKQDRKFLCSNFLLSIVTLFIFWFVFLFFYTLNPAQTASVLEIKEDDFIIIDKKITDLYSNKLQSLLKRNYYL